MTALDAIYRRLPTIHCQGKCAESCGPILATRAEVERMERASGQPLTVDRESATCGYLKNDRCTVYDVRPLICRLWGIAKEMPCPWGCVPSRVVGRQEGHTLIAAMTRVGGTVMGPTVI